jgi:outer membrane protein assembly factor BamB
MKCRISVQLIVLISLGLGLTMANPAVSEWICYKGSLERTSSSNAPAPDTCYLLWEVDTGSELVASPVVKDGNVFQVALEKLFCIDSDMGNSLWISDVPVHRSEPFLTDDKIIVATNRGILALSIETGEIIWEYVYSGRIRPEFPLEDYIVSSPAVSKGRVVVGTMPYFYAETNPFTLPEELFLICLDEKSGNEKWYLETGLGVRSSPCVIYGKAFAASREMLCIDIKTGKVLWNSEDIYPWELGKPVKERYAYVDSTPALYHGILVAGSSEEQWIISQQQYVKWQKIVFMDQYTGDILWEWVEKGVSASSPAVYQEYVYTYSFDGMVRCLSFLEGKELWKTSISEPREKKIYKFRLWPSPTVADDKVYIGSIEGVFYCLDAETGEILWKYETEGEIRSAPAVVPGKVLVSSTDGTLYCFGIDPATYKTKAQQYIEEKMYDKAKEFLIMAKEYAKKNEDIEEINQLLDLVEKEMPDYVKRQEKLAKAESLMDEADKIMWDKRFRKAKALYTKAYDIYTELDDEFKIKFCEKRIEYIEKRIPEENWLKNNWWLLVILTSIGIISVFLMRKYR